MDITKATSIMGRKIFDLDIDRLDISAYSKRYLKHYQRNLSYYLDAYSQLLTKAISKLKVPIREAVFLDYGGGSGLLSYLAVTLGFKKVVYNDLYEISVADVKILSQKLDLKIDEFIVGDIGQVINSLHDLNIRPNLICSFDVLEHIYDVNDWFSQLRNLDHPFQLLFTTSANGNNPFVRHKLKKLHVNAEFKDREKKDGWKEIDLHTSFLNERKKIIAKHFSELSEAEINQLAKHTRGLKETDIQKEVENFIKYGTINYKITHPTNTCDPYTGNWTEKIIETKELCKFINNLGFSCFISNSFYPYSNRQILNAPKYLLNFLIRLFGKTNLFFSPGYTIELEWKS